MRIGWLMVVALSGCGWSSTESPRTVWMSDWWGSARSLGQDAEGFTALQVTLDADGESTGRLTLFSETPQFDGAGRRSNPGEGVDGRSVPFVMSLVDQDGDRSRYDLQVDDPEWIRPLTLVLGPDATDNRLLIAMDDRESSRHRDMQVFMLHQAESAGDSTDMAVSPSGIYVQGDRTWRVLDGQPDQQAGVWSVALRGDGTGWVHQDGNTYGYNVYGDAKTVTTTVYPHLTGRFRAGVPVPGTEGTTTRRFVPDRPVDRTVRGQVSIELVVEQEIPRRLLIRYDEAPDESIALTTGQPDSRGILGMRHRTAPQRHAAHAARVVPGEAKHQGPVSALEVDTRARKTREALSTCVARSPDTVPFGTVQVRWARDEAGHVQAGTTGDLQDTSVPACLSRMLGKLPPLHASEPYEVTLQFELQAPQPLVTRPGITP